MDPTPSEVYRLLLRIEDKVNVGFASLEGKIDSLQTRVTRSELDINTLHAKWGGIDRRIHVEEEWKVTKWGQEYGGMVALLIITVEKVWDLLTR